MGRQPDLKLHEEHALQLLESSDADGDGIFNADGTVNVAVIRPCEGRGPGARIYTPELLEATASQWSGYPSYMNHEDPQARVQLRKLRRGPDELAGELRETVWDPTYTTPDDAKYGYQQGAVVGKFMPATELVESLLRRIPGQLKLSINAKATSLKRAKRSDNKPGWLVEGIQDDPENSSVDLVTAMGAGGHVRSLIESVYGPGHGEPSATDGLADLTDDQLREWLQEHRPGVLEQGDGGVSDMTLQEALQSEEVKTFLAEQISAGVDTALQEALPAAVAAERDSIRDEVRGELGKSTRTAALHREALRLIEATKLPESAKAVLKERFAVEESDDGETITPVGSLALIEAVEEDGKVTKTAKEVLAERVDAEAKSLRSVLREALPTISHAPGGGEGGGTPAPARFGGERSSWANLARSRGLNPEIFGATPVETGS